MNRLRLRKNRVEDRDSRKNLIHFRGIYGQYLKMNIETPKDHNFVSGWKVVKFRFRIERPLRGEEAAKGGKGEPVCLTSHERDQEGALIHS
jgi:hypothetical protein